MASSLTLVDYHMQMLLTINLFIKLDNVPKYCNMNSPTMDTRVVLSLIKAKVLFILPSQLHIKLFKPFYFTKIWYLAADMFSGGYIVLIVVTGVFDMGETKQRQSYTKKYILSVYNWITSAVIWKYLWCMGNKVS